MKIERDLLVALLLGIIVLIAALQAMQLTGIKNSAGTGAVASAPVSAAAASPASSPSAPAPQQAAVPSSLQNLPNMVGGC